MEIPIAENVKWDDVEAAIALHGDAAMPSLIQVQRAISLLHDFIPAAEQQYPYLKFFSTPVFEYNAKIAPRSVFYTALGIGGFSVPLLRALQAGLSPNDCIDGVPLLHIAVSQLSQSSCQVLLDAGASINATVPLNYLNDAAQFIDQGIWNETSLTALQLAKARGLHSIAGMIQAAMAKEAIETVLTRVRNTSDRDRARQLMAQYPLDLVLKSERLRTAINKWDQTYIEKELADGADPTVPYMVDYDGVATSPLVLACTKKQILSIQRMIGTNNMSVPIAVSGSVNLSIFDVISSINNIENFNQLLYVAVSSMHPDAPISSALWKMCESMKARDDREGKACSNAFERIFVALSYGAFPDNVATLESFIAAPLLPTVSVLAGDVGHEENAAEQDSERVIDVLLARANPVLPIVTKMIERGLSPNAHIGSDSLLDYAINWDDVPVASMLIEAGALVNEAMLLRAEIEPISSMGRLLNVALAKQAIDRVVQAAKIYAPKERATHA
jgi:hypothetical protein